jgi:hypothetical protein
MLRSLGGQGSYPIGVTRGEARTPGPLPGRGFFASEPVRLDPRRTLAGSGEPIADGPR